MPFTRRDFLLHGTASAGAAGIAALALADSPSSGSAAKSGRFFGYQPFTQDLYIPPTLTALPIGTLTRISPESCWR